MRRIPITFFSAVLATFLATPSFAQHHGGFGGPGMGFHGFSQFHGGGFRGSGPGFHGFAQFHGGFHHLRGPAFRSSVAVFFGPPLFWGPEFFVYGYPYYVPYPAAYVEPPPVRWYCPDQGYYPDVRTCARGWLRVLPDDSTQP